MDLINVVHELLSLLDQLLPDTLGFFHANGKIELINDLIRYLTREAAKDGIKLWIRDPPFSLLRWYVRRGWNAVVRVN